MDQNRTAFKVAMLAGAAASALFWNSAVAQTTPAAGGGAPPAAEAASTETSLPPLIVTARRREENVQKVPLTVSVVTGQTLAQHEIVDFYDLQKMTPSLNVTSLYGTQNFFSVRGVGTFVPFGQGVDSSVGYVVDDVPMGLGTLYELETYDLANVQVLDGPQGMLFGKNASAGLINIVTNDPVLNSTQMSAQAQYGNMDTPGSGNRFHLDGMANMPLGDDAALRVDAFWLHDDELIQNVNPAEAHEFLGQERGGFRAKLLWEPTNQLKVQLGADYTHVVGPGDALFDYGVTQPGDAVDTVSKASGVTPSLTNTSIASSGRIVSIQEIYGTSLKVNYDIGGGYTFTDVTAFRHEDATGLEDTDWFPYSVQGATTAVIANLDQTLPPASSENQFSEEIRFTSPADRRFTYQVGGYYQYFNSVSPYTVGSSELGGLFPGGLINQLATQVPAIAADSRVSPTAGNVVTCAPAANLFGSICEINPALQALGYTTLNNTAGASDSSSRSVAGYAEGTFKVTDALRVTLGGRYTHDDKRYFYEVVDGNGLNGIPASLINYYPSQVHDQGVTASNFSWRGSVQYDITPTTMAYFTYARGYKAPGFTTPEFGPSESPVPVGPYSEIPAPSSLATQPGIPIVKPELNDNYEIGIKSELFDHRLRMNVTGFYELFHDFQTSQPACTPNPPGPCVTNIVNTNATGLTSRGFEGEFTALPFKGLTLNAGFMYDDTHFTGLTGSCYPTQTKVLNAFTRGDCTLFTSGSLAPAALSSLGLTQAQTAYLYSLTPAQAAALAPLPAYGPAFAALAAEGWASGYTNETGAQLSLAPKWTLYFNARYDHEVWSGWSGFIQGDVNFKSSYNFFANGDPNTDLPAVAIVNASTGLHTDNGRLGITIYCKNLTDRRVPTFRYLASDSTLTGDSLAEKPDYVQGFSPDSFREVGVTLNYKM